MSESKTSELAKSWNTYWQGTANVGAFCAGGVAHPDITKFWTMLFQTISSQKHPVRLLDVATGNGAILAIANSMLDPKVVSMTCVDISASAIENVRQRFPAVTGVVADALSIPLPGEDFDLVTSQFGVEYAGLTAINEAARMVRSGGQLVLMMHVVDSIVHRECKASRAAIEKLQAADFVPLASAFFKAGFAAVRGADRRAYDDAGLAFAPAIEAAEAIMAEFGEGVAGDTIARMYSDVERMHNRLPNYDPDEVLGWLRTMDGELQAYAGRMSSMIGAAVTTDEFNAACGQLRAAGFELQRSEALYTQDRSDLLAWILVASR